MEWIGEIETRLGKLVKELDYGGYILSRLTRMDVSSSDFMKEIKLSLYSCFTKQS